MKSNGDPISWFVTNLGVILINANLLWKYDLLKWGHRSNSSSGSSDENDEEVEGTEFRHFLLPLTTII